MNEQQAINLIKETFEKPFDKIRFINFISNLLNLKQNEILNEHPQAGKYIPEAYRQYINSFYRIAKYEDDSGKKIVVLIVHLKKETSLERARSMQRNFIAWYLKLSRGYYKDAALVAFVSPDDEDWRFSFVKIQYLFKDNKAAEMLSSALRYSFLVGKNEISYTAQTQLRPFLLDDISKPSLEMLEQAFSVEKVSDKFFKEYKFLYKKALVEFNSNEVFTKVLEQNSNLSVDLFVRKLLGQVVFLYFLQKKGWLGIKIEESGWKDGNRKFLRWAFEDCKKKNKNYFDKFLQPLFYAGFNKKEDLFQYDEFQFKIPFLNGGIFEELFHWESTFINPPNNLFSNDEETGILDIFDRYNFTIDENTAFEKEIAVDPEMLGKVFENLLPENLRKGKGAYYTPREIVAYMTKESLVNYLTSKITPADSDDKSKIEEKVRRLFDYKDQYINKKNKDKYGKEFENQFYEMLDIVEEVNKHLKAIKIVDPACGSGAFPMGILLEIVSLREYIENEFLDNNISNYQLKKETIQNSIYGVDIDPGAVEIAKLRFWLSLVVDAEKPEPLPNLDYKIMQGNSLIESFEGIDLSRVMSDKYFEMTLVDSQMDLLRDNGKQQKFVFSDKRKETIINLKEKYYPETDPIKKKEIHQKIDKIVLEHIHLCLDIHKAILETQITEISCDLKMHTKDKPQIFIEHLLNESKQAKELSKLQSELASVDVKFTKLEQLYCSTERPFFLWHLYFSEIFEGENEGFDIVIANPPYVRADNPVIKNQRKSIMTSKNFQTLWEKWDLYVAFIEKGYGLLANNGILEFIIPDAYMSSKYAEKSHEYFLKNATINRIDFCSDLKIFEAAVRNIIIEFKKHINTKHIPLRISHKERWDNFIVLPSKNQIEMGQNTFKLDSEGKTIGDLSNILTWGEICYVSYGLRPSSDERYWKGEFKKEELISDVKDKIHPKAYIEGKWINKYFIEKAKYLEWDTNRSPKKLVRPTFPDLYVPEKIVKGRMTDAVYDNKGLLCNDSCFVSVLWKDLNGVTNRSIEGSIKKDFKIKNISQFRQKLEENSNKFNLKYLLAILNSKFAYKFLDSVRRSQIGFYPDDLKKLPIKKISKANQKPFIKIVDQILIDKKAGKDTQMLEDKIDLMVYKLYELSYEEVKIVDPELDKVLEQFGIGKEEYKRMGVEEFSKMDGEYKQII